MADYKSRFFATSAQPGAVSVDPQTFSGQKTFADTVLLPSDGLQLSDQSRILIGTTAGKFYRYYTHGSIGSTVEVVIDKGAGNTTGAMSILVTGAANETSGGSEGSKVWLITAYWASGEDAVTTTLLGTATKAASVAIDNITAAWNVDTLEVTFGSNNDFSAYLFEGTWAIRGGAGPTFP